MTQTNLDPEEHRAVPTAGVLRPDSPYTDKECEDIIAKLEQLLDGELDASKEKDVMEMVHSCNYCLEQYHIEKSLRRLIKSGFHNIMMSANLVSRIKRSIQLARGEK